MSLSINTVAKPFLLQSLVLHEEKEHKQASIGMYNTITTHVSRQNLCLITQLHDALDVTLALYQKGMYIVYRAPSTKLGAKTKLAAKFRSASLPQKLMEIQWREIA